MTPDQIEEAAIDAAHKAFCDAWDAGALGVESMRAAIKAYKAAKKNDRAQHMDELVEAAQKANDTIARLLGMPKQRLDNPQIQDVLQKRHNDLCAILSKIEGKQ